MRKNKSSIGCLFWIALILLVLVIFLFNRKTIENVLEATGFLNLITKNNNEMDIERISPETDPMETESPSKDIDSPKQPEIEPDSEIIIDIKPAVPTETPEETLDKDHKIRKSRLYFVNVNSNGVISLKSIIRPVYYTDSPLTATIKVLLKGLSSSELNQGLLSLIPEGTKLKAVYIKDSTVFIDFNETFHFNSFGFEGYKAQLKQIVYTATEFSTVDNVQILIDGKKYQYMGAEGIYIGAPLSRNSF